VRGCCKKNPFSSSNRVQFHFEIQPFYSTEAYISHWMLRPLDRLRFRSYLVQPIDNLYFLPGSVVASKSKLSMYVDCLYLL
jgi:hypothetical protein